MKQTAATVSMIGMAVLLIAGCKPASQEETATKTTTAKTATVRPAILRPATDKTTGKTTERKPVVKPTSQVKPTVKTEPVDWTKAVNFEPKDIVSMTVDNPFKLKAYENKPMRVRGYIYSISQTKEKKPVVNYWTYTNYSIGCLFDNVQDVLSLSPEQYIEIGGTYAGETKWGWELTDCVILKHEPENTRIKKRK